MRLDKPTPKGMVKRAQEIAISDRMPEPLSTDETYYQCKFCPAHEFCFGEKKPLVNCRLAHTQQPGQTAHGSVNGWQATIPTDAQREGCRLT